MILQPEIDKAATILRAGGLVAVPTETVYGLGADAGNPAAVARIFAVKQRPTTHPLIVHLADSSQLRDWAREIPAEVELLAASFWPGPLTLILKKRSSVLDGVTGGQDTVAIRIPRHPVAAALLKAFGGGLVAPSANRFTRISPTTAAAVYAELGSQVDMILDGGPCVIGLESTILDLSGEQPCILRPGMISPETIAAVLQRSVAVTRQDHPAEIRVPGMHHVHYAPTTRTLLVTAEQLTNDLPTNKLPIVCLTHSAISLPQHAEIKQICMPANAAEYAQVLYATLRAQDQNQYQCIFVEAVPDDAAWDAIRDRLTKACSSLLSDNLR